MSDLSTPDQVIARLESIEADLALRQGVWEKAALEHYRAKRDKEKARAVKFLAAEGSVAARSAQADAVTALDGAREEALYESLKAVIRVLETRASIGMSILRSQGRS